MIKRVLKIGLAAALIAGSLGWYSYERFAMVSSEAFTVGFLLDIRAPADGRVQHGLHRFGEVEPGAQLGVLQTEVTDLPSAAVARAELEATQHTIGALKRSIMLSETLMEEAGQRSTKLRARRRTQLGMLAARARTRLAEAEAEYRSRLDAQEQRRELCRSGLLARLDCNERRYNVELSERQLASGAQEKRLADFLHGSSKEGLDVGQEYGSELGYSRQFENDLKLRVLNLKQELAEKEGREQVLAARVQPPSVPLATHARLQVWNVLKMTRSLVNQGDTLFEVVSCDEAHVLVTLDQGKYERLGVGRPVVVKMAGSRFVGTVKQLLGGLAGGSPVVRLVPPIPAYKGTRDIRARAVLVFSAELAKTKHGCTPGLPVEVDFSPVQVDMPPKRPPKGAKDGALSSL